MKIKTITKQINVEGLAEFDQEVNAALADGWIVGKREVLPGVDLGGGAYFAPCYHAELVLPDPTPEPDPAAMCDPLDLLRQLKNFCNDMPNTECQAGACPLAPYCDAMAAGRAIDEWELPEVVE